MNLAEYCERRKFENCLSGVHGHQNNLKFSDYTYRGKKVNEI